MDDYIIREDAFLALTGDITDCTIEEFIARLRGKLSKLPSVGKDINVTTNEDCISRQAVIEIAVETGAWETQSRVMDLPSVTPKEKTGHWIRVTDKTGHLVWECDKCRWQQRYNTYFCPNCGAKMFEPQESERV